MRPQIIAGGMLRTMTPVENYLDEYGLWVKREDKSCPPPGPPFSKARGVFRRVQSRSETVIGVLDTYHSQAGHAVARACQVLGKTCINYYPEYKNDPGHRPPQDRAKQLGAVLVGIPAGRSCILYHQARKETESRGGYMMPNALKLSESIEETAKETANCPRPDVVLIPASSGTIAAGVIRGFGKGPTYLIHLGYSRSESEVQRYLLESSGVDTELTIIDEGYEYKNQARSGETPPWACNMYYDLKAFRWWCKVGKQKYNQSLFWNIG